MLYIILYNYNDLKNYPLLSIITLLLKKSKITICGAAAKWNTKRQKECIK